MTVIRAPFFSAWLCRQHRRHKFTYKNCAEHLGVSPQTIDSYSCGRSHPQIMRFVPLCRFIAKVRGETTEAIILELLDVIEKDRIYRQNETTHKN